MEFIKIFSVLPRPRIRDILAKKANVPYKTSLMRILLLSHAKFQGTNQQKWCTSQSISHSIKIIMGQKKSQVPK
jgi:hypothetical protein